MLARFEKHQRPSRGTAQHVAADCRPCRIFSPPKFGAMRVNRGRFIAIFRTSASARLPRYSDFTLIVAASITTGVVYHFLAFDYWGDIDAFVVIGCYSGLTFVLLCQVAWPLSAECTSYPPASKLRGIVSRLGRSRPVYDLAAVSAEDRR